MLAVRDMAAMEAWFTQPGSGARARRRVMRIRASIEGLREHPCRHRRGAEDFRELIVEQYEVVYRVSPDTGSDQTAGDVTILRVFGPGQLRDL